MEKKKKQTSQIINSLPYIYEEETGLHYTQTS